MGIVARKWSLSLKILPLAAAAMAAKYLLHIAGWEVISLNPLFSGLLAATVFLLGFLITGVLTDYKESEKLPMDLAVSIDALADEAAMVLESKKADAGREVLVFLEGLCRETLEWFHERATTTALLGRVEEFCRHLLVLEPLVPPPYMIRMKQEQSALRRTIIRIDAIRRTSFIRSGYAVAEVVSALLIAAFILSKIEPFYESLFFVAVITFLLTYLLALIRDLDDPFEYGEKRGGGDEVSLHPLEEVAERVAQRLSSLR